MGIPWVEDFFAVLIEKEVEVLENLPKIGIFDRYLASDGTLTEANCTGRFSHIEELLRLKESHHEMILCDKIIEADGHYPMNVVSILYDCIWSYWTQLQNGAVKGDEYIGDVFSVSGMDMINYTKDPSLRACFDRMYKTLLESKKFEWLPRHLRLVFLPGAFFRFLPCNAEEELLHNVQKIISLQNERNNLNRLQGAFQKGILVQKSSSLRKLESIAKTRFKDSFSRRRGFSQYDLLNGEFISQNVVNGLMNLTFEEIRWWFRTS